MEHVIIKPYSYAGIPMGTRRSIIPHEWRHNILCESLESLWEDYGLTIVEGSVDYTKGPATLCVINLGDAEVVIKAGQIIAKLSPMDDKVKTSNLTNSSLPTQN